MGLADLGIEDSDEPEPQLRGFQGHENEQYFQKKVPVSLTGELNCCRDHSKPKC